MKCDVCEKEIVGDAYHPAYIDGWKRIEGTTCSHKCSIRFIDEKKNPKQCPLCKRYIIEEVKKDAV